MRIAGIAAMSLVAMTSMAEAATFTYQFTAEAPVLKFSDDTESSLADELWADFGPGGTMSVLTGTITFNDTLDSISGVTRTYAPAVYTLDGYDLSGAWPGRETRVTDGATSDAIATLSDVTGTTPQNAVDIIWRDSSGSAIGAGNPFSALDIADFDLATLLIYNPRLTPGGITPASSTDRVDFEITSLTLAPVPLPAGLPLLAGGMGLLLALRRKRTRAG